MENTSCGVINKTAHHASIIVHTALTLADRSQTHIIGLSTEATEEYKLPDVAILRCNWELCPLCQLTPVAY